MPIKSVFFDLDGTLLDTARDLGGALNATLEHHGMKALTHETIRPHVSNGAAALIKLGFGYDITEQEFQQKRQFLLDYYLQNVADETIAFKGIEELVKTLSENKISWGVATNKPWLYTEALFNQLRFFNDPIALICPEHVETKKPAADSIFLACSKANCDVSEMVYIGDHKRDIECGQNAGCLTIAAAYGYIDSPAIALDWQADHTVNCATEIWPILENLI